MDAEKRERLYLLSLTKERLAGLVMQYKWERDIAMNQLEEHGIKFVDKKENKYN